MSFLNFNGKKPPHIGPQKKLKLCDADSQNCVCSLNPVEQKSIFIEPLKISGEFARYWQKLIQTLDHEESIKVIIQTDSYIHAEATSSFFGFVDDLEFLVDAKHEIINVRSASRVGRSDFGVNRKRIETIRQKLKG